MTYSVLDPGGNLIDAFRRRDAALACLARIAQAEPEAATEVALIVQADNGEIVGPVIYASGVSGHTETSRRNHDRGA